MKMSKRKDYELKLDQLDNLIISIIKLNNGITAVLIQYKIRTEFNEDINPAIMVTRLDRLLVIGIIVYKAETVGKYYSRQFYFNKNWENYDKNMGQNQ
jgi:hypothetical protein